MDKNPSMLRATLIGGSVFGVLAGLPYVGGLNIACCALIVAGGFLAAFLYSKECATSGIAFTAGNGAMVGLVAGLFYSLASTVVSIPFRPEKEEIYDAMEQMELPPEAADMANSAVDLFFGPLGLVIGFFLTLLLAAVFSTIGGVIGGAVFKVEPTPPEPPLGTGSMGGSDSAMPPPGSGV